MLLSSPLFKQHQNLFQGEILPLTFGPHYRVGQNLTYILSKKHIFCTFWPFLLMGWSKWTNVHFGFPVWDSDPNIQSKSAQNSLGNLLQLFTVYHEDEVASKQIWTNQKCVLLLQSYVFYHSFIYFLFWQLLTVLKILFNPSILKLNSFYCSRSDIIWSLISQS